MNEIGAYYKESREEMGVSLEEASADTKVPVIALEQIEDGSIGSFKDIFKLKEYLTTYAKYLGLDSEKIIDEFNEYMFEYTSKIPLEEIEKQVTEKQNEEEENLKETHEIRAVSPYLMSEEKNGKKKAVVLIVVIIILVTVALIWAIKQMV